MPDSHQKLLHDTDHHVEVKEVVILPAPDPLPPYPQPQLHAKEPKSKYLVGLWFLTLSGLVTTAMMLGGYVRLTESDLAMVDFAPIQNMKPPFTADEWDAEFLKYQKYPDFEFRHPNVTMDDFKFMYRLAWIHRMGARFIGLFFVIPMLVFWAKGYFDRRTKIKSVIIACLLLLQVLMGWLMVQSGLSPGENSDPKIVRPCQYRVVAHLTIALSIYAICLHSALCHLLHPHDHSKVKKIKPLRALACTTKAVIFISIIMGGFVAALDGGQIHNDWPMYSGRFAPEGMFRNSPGIANFFNNPGTAQFAHRFLGYLTLILVTVTFVFGHKLLLSKGAKLSMTLLLIFTWFQGFVGVMTLIFQAPVWLAAFHQHVGLGLLTFALLFCHEIRQVPPTPTNFEI